MPTLKVLDGPTILAGKSMSDGVDCTGSTRVLRLIMPSDWTMAPLSIQLSSDGVNFYDLYNTQIPEFSVYPVTVAGVRARSSITLPAGTGSSIAWLRLRSGTFAVPVNQTADRAFKVVLEMPDAADGGGVGPAGPTGSQGPPGPTGAGGSGSVGATGPTGTQGSAGTPGTPGSAGATGPTGTVSLKGTVAGDEAPAGNIGEYLSANNSAGVSLTTAVTANVTSFSLPPGDWNVNATVYFVPSGTGPNSLLVGISNVSATLPTDNQVLTGSGAASQIWSSGFTSGKEQSMPAGPARFNTTTAGTIYLVAQSSFGGGSVVATGRLTARRMR